MFVKRIIVGPYRERDEALKFIEETEKPIKYTYGLGYRHPTTYKVPITKEEANKYIMEHYSMLDVEEYEDYVHINQYSEMDLW